MYRAERRRRGMALLTTLVVLGILIVVASSLAFVVRTETVLAAGEQRRVQAEWLAEAGLQRALVYLRDEQPGPRSLYQDDSAANGGTANGGSSSSPTDTLAGSGYGAGSNGDQPGEQPPVVIHLDSNDEQGLTATGARFFVDGLDEAARINLNNADEALLGRLLPDEPELVNSILDWRDSDSDTRADGAEAEYYSTLNPPYQPRNALFETLDELLLVKGVTPARFFGDEGLSPLADESERQEIDPSKIPLSKLFTIDSYDENSAVDGTERINLSTATKEELQQAFDGVLQPSDVDAIVKYRDKPTTPAATPNPADSLQDSMPSSVDDLKANVASAAAQSAAAAAAPADSAPPAQAPATPTVAGLVRVLDRTKLQSVYDKLTNSSDTRMTGLVNLNTASRDVLMALDGMDDATADAIVRARSEKPFETVGDLLSLTEVTNERFEQVAPVLTTRGLAIRLVATGVVGEGTEAVQRRVTAIVQVELPRSQPTGTADAPETGADQTPPQNILRMVYHRVD